MKKNSRKKNCVEFMLTNSGVEIMKECEKLAIPCKNMLKENDTMEKNQK